MTVDELRERLVTLNQRELLYQDHPEESLHVYKPQDLDGSLVLPSPPASDRITLTRQNRHSIVPLHRHEYIEMNYVYAGRATSRIDGTDVELAEGDVSLLGTGVVHTVLPLGDDDVLLNFLMPQQLLESLLTRVTPADGDVAAILWHSMNRQRDHDRYLVVHTAPSDAFKGLVERICCEYLGDQLDGDVATDCYLTLIFVELARCWQLQVEVASRRREHVFVTEILRYVKRNCTTCTLTSVARHFGYNPSHLSRMISVKTGRTFKEHLTEARLERVATLLKTSDQPISTVAAACGWHSQTVFYQKFRDRYGCTPREYRDSFLIRSASM